MQGRGLRVETCGRAGDVWTGGACSAGPGCAIEASAGTGTLYDFVLLEYGTRGGETLSVPFNVATPRGHPACARGIAMDNPPP